MMRRGAWVAVLLGLTACSTAPPDSPDGNAEPFQVAARCTSGATRSINESEGQQMAPGRACNTCHAAENAASGEGDAPIFTVAGTVYPTGHEPDDCIASGAAGAQVIVTDAAGKVFTAAVNPGGNFLLEEELFTYPYQARVLFQGRERKMQGAQHIGDCNSCHTAAGTAGAPGRIVLP